MQEPTYQLPQETISINGVEFAPISGQRYLSNYHNAVKLIEEGKHTEQEVYRWIISKDLFFIVNFILKIPHAHHQFVVQACEEVQFGPMNRTLDLWAREHFKSSIITTARSIQLVCNDPNICIGLFSHSREIAKGFLRGIKQVLEGSELLKHCFPDIFHENPKRDAEKWSEEVGLMVKRDSFAKEATFEAWGLIDGMPTSKHFDLRIYDDVETDSNVTNSDMMRKTLSQYHLSHNLGKEGGMHWVIGTHYHHQAILSDLRKAKHSKTDEPFYHVRIKPATKDGTFHGESVMYSEEWHEERRQDAHTYACQQLLDPTPKGLQTLDPARIRRIDPTSIPPRLYKFMVIDQAGERTSDTRSGDWWANLVIGVEPYLDDLGASGIYIIDVEAGEMTHAEAMDAVVRVYLRNGRIHRLGVEKTGITTTEIHIANQLKAKGVYLSKEKGNLVKLTPGGKKKQRRIEDNLHWPLVNGKIFWSTAIDDKYYDRLCMEMEKFPVWHDDMLDALSYIYDMLADFRFYGRPGLAEEPEPDIWERLSRKRKRNKFRLSENGWMKH